VDRRLNVSSRVYRLPRPIGLVRLALVFLGGLVPLPDVPSRLLVKRRREEADYRTDFAGNESMSGRIEQPIRVVTSWARQWLYPDNPWKAVDLPSPVT
jgi:hypothetical protein